MLDTKALAEATASIVKQHVAAAVEPLLKRIEELEAKSPLPGKDGRDGVDGKDGASATYDEISKAVEAYLIDNPPPAGKDGRDGVNGKDGEPGNNGVDGKDGISLAGSVIDRDGNLVVTLSSGEHKPLGLVVGRDGRDGLNGKDGEPGASGKDGSDGLGFDDLDLVETDDGLALRFARGDVVKQFPLPVPVDCGVWKEKLYRKGQGTTWAGSFWIAQRDTDRKPDTEDSGWRLAVKRGRDGREVVTVKPRKDDPVKA